MVSITCFKRLTNSLTTLVWWSKENAEATVLGMGEGGKGSMYFSDRGV